MNREQAKEILQLYRPWTSDAEEAEVAEALNLAKADAELARWLKEHCAWQEAIRAKFLETGIPEALKEQIVSERKAALRTAVQRKVLVATMTAVLILGLFGLARFYWPTSQFHEDNTFAAFRLWTAGKVLRDYPKMDLETDDLAQIRRAVQQHSGPDYALPKALEATRPTGCATNLPDWNGYRVAMICFNSGKASASKQPDLFLFITDRSAVAGAPLPTSLQLTNFMKLMTASWSDGKRTYILGGLGDEEFVRKYL